MYPVKPNSQDRFNITRPFGVPNKAYAAGFHTGTDFGHQRDVEEVRASYFGTVVTVGNDPHGYGRYVVVRVVTRKRRQVRFVWYCHLESVAVRVGGRVGTGALIGIMGSTGNSTGRHLHYEERLEGNRYGRDAVEPILLTARRPASRALRRAGWR